MEKDPEFGIPTPSYKQDELGLNEVNSTHQEGSHAVPRQG